MEQEYQFQTEITEPPKPSKFWPTLNRILTLLLIIAVVAVVGRGVARGLTPPIAKEAAQKAKIAVTSGIGPTKNAVGSSKPVTMRDLRKHDKPLWQKFLPETGPKKAAPAKPRRRG